MTTRIDMNKLRAMAEADRNYVGDRMNIDDEPDQEPEPEPEEGDITTGDHRHFYQYGKLVLTIDIESDHRDALLDFMDRDQFWPNCWFISDHGNAHLISFDGHKRTRNRAQRIARAMAKRAGR